MDLNNYSTHFESARKTNHPYACCIVGMWGYTLGFNVDTVLKMPDLTDLFKDWYLWGYLASRDARNMALGAEKLQREKEKNENKGKKKWILF